jgi:hypothetical protein
MFINSIVQFLLVSCVVVHHYRNVYDPRVGSQYITNVGRSRDSVVAHSSENTSILAILI